MIDELIEQQLDNLSDELAQLGFDVRFGHFHYNFLDRVENLYILSEVIADELGVEPDDLPKNFGVQRGYSGGGVHSALYKTEVHKLPKNKQAKARQALDLFEKYFWQILDDVDNEASDAGELELWQSTKL